MTNIQASLETFNICLTSNNFIQQANNWPSDSILSDMICAVTKSTWRLTSLAYKKPNDFIRDTKYKIDWSVLCLNDY